MTSLLQNSWVVGIGGGIVSGLVVFFVTKWLFSSQGKRELLRKVAAANQEVILAVRQGIPEGNIPSGLILDSLLSSTARKHGLNTTELYSAKEISEDLIKEVMDSNFISADTKTLYCDQLARLQSPTNKIGDVPTTYNLKGYTYFVDRSRRSQVQVMSFTLALVAAFMSALLPLVASGRSELELPSSFLPVFLPVVATLAGLATMATALSLWRARSASHATDAALKASHRYLSLWKHVTAKKPEAD